MSIASELSALNGYILGAYDEINDKGGTVPANKNMANLASAIASISSGASPCRLTISSALGVNLACAYTTTTGTYSSTTFSTSTSIDTIAGGIVYVYNSAGNWTVDYATGCTAYNMGARPYTVALIVCTGATASIQFISSCLPAGTEILMASGETERIESVKVGCNIHSQEDCQVEKTYRHNYSGRIVTIYDTSGEVLLASTPNHLVMVNNVFTPVGDSNVGDKVMTKSGEVEIGAIVSNEFVGEVFNISVSDPHTYYAGAGLVLCHNKPI